MKYLGRHFGHECYEYQDGRACVEYKGELALVVDISPSSEDDMIRNPTPEILSMYKFHHDADFGTLPDRTCAFRGAVFVKRERAA